MKRLLNIIVSCGVLMLLFAPVSMVFADSSNHIMIASNTNTKAKAKSSSSSAGGGLTDIQSNLKSFGDRSYGPDAQRDPQKVVATIINAGLGLLGTLLVIYMVYGGMMWMTSNGESSKVDKAKSILRQAIVGIIIVISAYAISSFIIDAIVGGAKSK